MLECSCHDKTRTCESLISWTNIQKKNRRKTDHFPFASKISPFANKVSFLETKFIFCKIKFAFFKTKFYFIYLHFTLFGASHLSLIIATYCTIHLKFLHATFAWGFQNFVSLEYALFRIYCHFPRSQVRCPFQIFYFAPIHRNKILKETLSKRH